MKHCYKVGMGALFLAVIAGVSGGVAALSYQIEPFLFNAHGFNPSYHLINMVHTHARMMIFFTLQPALMVAFGTWFIPVLIGAKNFSFPLINTISLILLWIGFACNFLTFFSSHSGLWGLISLSLWAIASILFSINVLVTIINNRGPGIIFSSMPIFVWLQGIAGMLLLATASILLAFLTRDYWNNTLLLNQAINQTVQDFSYPLVMILILPAFGIIFHSLQTIIGSSILLNKRPIIGMACCFIGMYLFWNKSILNGFLGNSNFYEHIRTIFYAGLYSLIVGLSFYALRLFFLGRKSLYTPILWSLGSLFLFVVAWPYTGLVIKIGQIHSSVTYAVLFTVFAGFYLWMERICGKHYNEYLGKLHFYMTMIGVILTLNMVSLGKDTVFLLTCLWDFLYLFSYGLSPILGIVVVPLLQIIGESGL